MLESAGLVVNLKAPDLDAVAGFYERLGFDVLGRRSLFPGHEDVLIGVGDALLCIERGEAGGVNETLAFEVDDVEGAVAALRAAGVEPEEYDLPSFKTVNGVATLGDVQAAWVKDPGGNVIGIVTRARAGA